MSSPLSVKRRKVNHVNDTLAKPFVSPMRSGNVHRSPLKNNSNVVNQPYQPSTLAHTVKRGDIPADNRPVTKHGDLRATKATPKRKRPTFTSSSKRTDPAELAAQRALTAIEMQIKAIRNEIDALEQAASITNSTTDSELEALTEKWRMASQQAAEEIFGTVKERVCRMGGVAAWRESEKQKFERSHGMGEFAPEPEEEDNADCEFDSQGEELPEEEQAFRLKEKRRVRKEAEEAADVGDSREELVGADDGQPKIWQEPGNDDDVRTHCHDAT